MENLIHDYTDIFYHEGEASGVSPTIKHMIILEYHNPATQPYRRIPIYLWTELEEHIHDLLQKRIITERSLDFASGLVVFHEETGMMRMFVDYRKLPWETDFVHIHSNT